MKNLSVRILLLFSFFFLNCSDSNIIKPPLTVEHGWVVQAPELGIHKFFAVDFTDDNNGWIVGSGGTILHTNNGGLSWSKQNSNTDELLYKAFFLDNNHGWICNLNGSIFHTSDGGQEWSLQYTEEKLALHNIFFSDENHGWVVGRGYIDDSLNDGSVVLGTTDGGETWFDLIRDNQLGGQLTGVYFLDSLKGWIVGGYIGGTLYTEDGGHTWQPRETLSGSFSDLIFFNDTVGIAYAVTAAVLKTTDASISWSWLPVITNGRWLHDMEFVGEQHGWLVGEKGYINQTTDGGDSWNHQESGTNNMLRSISFTNENNGWAVGKGGTVIHTTDGGATWESVVEPTQNALADIQMINRSLGCAIGANGTILKTINGGENWELINNIDSNWFYALSLPSMHNWYAVGNAGTILKSQNQGISWYSVAPNENVHYRDVFFLDENIGWAVGGNHFVKTSDGGTNWILDTLPIISYEELNSIYFIDSVTGWLTTHLGKMFKTTNNGLSWTELNYDGSGNFLDIYFLTKDHGFIVGRNLALYETKDGGTTWNWIYMSNGRLEDYNSIYFTDSLTGWIVGEDFLHLNGVIYKTTDGGANWELITKAVENPLYSVFFLDNKLGWICGENGTILHTNDGGSEF